jgi:hypothetical protein
LKNLRKILIKTTVTIFSISLNLFGQNQNFIIASNDNITKSHEIEPLCGYWELSGSKIDNFSDNKYTNWIRGNEIISGTCKWQDVLKIEHTVSSSFKWDQPAQKLVPGTNIKISGSYINDEYSTPNRVLTGIHITLDKSKNGVSTDIIKLTKDNKQHYSEDKTALISIPNFYKGDNREINIIVDCYIGKDHYIATYTYLWVDSAL